VDNQVESIFRKQDQFHTANALGNAASRFHDGAHTRKQVFVGGVQHRLTHNPLEH
jgi:hypothetical protein